MAETIVQITEGAGKKLHAWDRVIGANTVLDEVVLLGMPYFATYRAVSNGEAVSTANSHVFQLMAGASLKVYVRRIRVYLWIVVTTGGFGGFDLFRLTTAGTGGTALTESPLDTTDAASGAQAMTLPTVKGTEGVVIDRQSAMLTQTVTATPATGPNGLLCDFDWSRDPLQKSLIIPAGTSNGICVKNTFSQAAGQVLTVCEYIEASF